MSSKDLLVIIWGIISAFIFSGIILIFWGYFSRDLFLNSYGWACLIIGVFSGLSGFIMRF